MIHRQRFGRVILAVVSVLLLAGHALDAGVTRLSELKGGWNALHGEHESAIGDAQMVTGFGPVASGSDIEWCFNEAEEYPEIRTKADSVIHLPKASATVIHVDVNAVGPAHDGTSWCMAYLTIDEAMDVATTGVTIRIADGVYMPNTNGLPDPCEASFCLKDGVTLEGGYAGCGASDPDFRDINSNASILSGDLAGNDVGCNWWDPSLDENSYHVLTNSDADSNVTIDGFVICGGRGNRGGGIYIEDGVVTMTRCTFDCNYGGMYSGVDAIVALMGCIFSNNYSSDEGAGILNEGTASLTDCLLTGNDSYDDTGGILNTGTVTLKGCMFIENSGNEDFGHAGGLANYGTATLIGCTFSRNWHVWSGGIANGGDLMVINTLFSGNYSYGAGGALTCEGGSATIINSTFHGNSVLGASGGGIFLADGADLDLQGSVLWGNSREGSSTESDQIETYNAGTVSVSYTCIEGLNTFVGNNNMGDDPLFVQPGHWDDGGTPWEPWDDVWTDGDYHLSSGSPCIDAADNSEVPPDFLDLDGDGDTVEPIPFDLDGRSRFVDDPCMVDTGDGASPIVDMGAYEYKPDCNLNGVDDNIDVAIGTSRDCNSNGCPDECELEGNDCNTNAVPDQCDVADGTSEDVNDNGIPDECEPTVILVANVSKCDPGDMLTVDAYVIDVKDMRSYQLQLAVAGGSAGTLARQGLHIDESREDYVFHTSGEDVTFTELSFCRLGASLASGSVTVIGDRKYLGTFLLQSTGDVAGGFTMEIDDIGASSMLLDSAQQSISFCTLDLSRNFGPSWFPWDTDCDGDLDLADYTSLADCLAGPHVPPMPSFPTAADDCLTVFDADSDGDVDLEDFAAFEVAFAE